MTRQNMAFEFLCDALIQEVTWIRLRFNSVTLEDLLVSVNLRINWGSALMHLGPSLLKLRSPLTSKTSLT